MRNEILAVIAALAVGTTAAVAQAPQESPPDPTITENEATTPSEPRTQMPMRREQPIVPDTTAPAKDGPDS